jgi:hypothetical protein
MGTGFVVGIYFLLLIKFSRFYVASKQIVELFSQSVEKVTRNRQTYLIIIQVVNENLIHKVA